MNKDTGMSRSTTLWLAASGGGADRVRIVLTAFGAAVGILALTAAATVAVTGADDGPYTSAVLNQPGLHPGLIFGLVALCVPLLAFTGQCARIGAPARDHRLASLRMQGATPRDVLRVAALETGLSAGVGAIVGMVLYFVLRHTLGGKVMSTYTMERDVTYDKGNTGRVTDTITEPALRLPTDVLPPWPVLLALVLAIPIAATLCAAVALRRVAITPFGVVRREQRQPLRTMPAALFVFGTISLALSQGIPRTTEAGVMFFAILIATGVGLVLGTAALASTIGQVVVARTANPSLLIAGRRMLAAPAQAGRASAALLLIVLLWSFAAGFRVYLLAYSDNDFYADTTRLGDIAFALGAAIAAAGLLVDVVDGVISRRRVLAGLSAAGTPRAVLDRSVLAETMLPIALPVVLAATAGILGARGTLGTTVKKVVPTADGTDAYVATISLGVPWLTLLLLVAGTLIAVLLATSAALPLLRRSTNPSELRAT